MRPPAWARWELAAGAFLVLAGLLLRLNGYADFPSATANADEWAWAWAGQTLLTKGVPTGWSYLHAYPLYTEIRLHGTGYPLVTPWLDHPPLFALLVGLFQVVAGQHTLAAASTAAIRLPAVLLGTVSIGLVQAVGRRLSSPGAALAGAALLAVTPAAVLLSREVESEALLAPLFLLALLLVHRLRTSEGSSWTAVALAAVAAAASLTKVPGLTVGLAAAIVLINGRHWQAAAWAAGGAAAGLVLYALYGAHYDWSIFLSVLNAQAGRRSGVMGAFEFIASPAGINTRLRDGWWLLGWLAVAALAIGRDASPRQWLLAWPAVAYMLAIMALADERVVARYGWYHIAVYPLIYLAAGWLVWRAVRRPSPALLGLVFGLGGATAFSLALGAPWAPPPWVLLALLAAFLLPVLVDRRWGQLVAAVGMGLMLIAAAAASLDLAGNAGFF